MKQEANDNIINEHPVFKNVANNKQPENEKREETNHNQQTYSQVNNHQGLGNQGNPMNNAHEYSNQGSLSEKSRFNDDQNTKYGNTSPITDKREQGQNEVDLDRLQFNDDSNNKAPKNELKSDQGSPQQNQNVPNNKRDNVSLRKLVLKNNTLNPEKINFIQSNVKSNIKEYKDGSNMTENENSLHKNDILNTEIKVGNRPIKVDESDTVSNTQQTATPSNQGMFPSIVETSQYKGNCDTEIKYGNTLENKVNSILMDNNGILQNNPPTYSAEKSQNQSQATDRVRVLYDYNATEPVELTIRENDIVTVLLRRDDGWWKGVIINSVTGEQSVGLFPSNYTTPIN
ncbi:hypothetical protein BB560_003787 [Smittium megazygosporum]|uniref:SH3 domain-containing protein n=1 Tax=Smittium megazygosporum TaxID=133381 RepID=A0A2T9ZB07_9FUNG|nr:hypothetical protein BB560_003787 [Smittium megazygosporum]